MLGFIQGQLIAKQPAWALVNIQGLGYEIHLPLNVYANLPEINQEVSFWLHQVVREDANLLYGFASLDDRQLYRELIKISGIGPKVGLAIMSSMNATSLVRAVEMQDITTLTRIPGIGKKTAERLLLELPDRLKAWQQVHQAEIGLDTPAANKPAHNPALAETEAALVSLGYNLTQASKVIHQVATAEMTTQQLLKACLQQLSQK